MKAFKCDRCNRYCDELGFTIKEMDPLNYIHPGIVGLGPDVYKILKNLELCKDCASKFFDIFEHFLTGRPMGLGRT